MTIFIVSFSAAELALSETVGCESDLDCFNNGDCVSGVCHCDAAWNASEHCDVLNFDISHTDPRSGYHNASEASWGGNALFDANTGTYHLFAAQMANGCGLGHWGTNSQIIRAESPNATGPFVFKEVVLQPFAHNPTARLLPDNQGVVIYFIGSGDESKDAIVNCSNTTTADFTKKVSKNSIGRLSSSISSSSSSVSIRSHRSSSSGSSSSSGDISSGSSSTNSSTFVGSIHAIYSAKGLFCPWSDPVAIPFVEDAAWGQSVTNPSPYIDEDGTVTLALQRGFNDNPGKELIGVARATSWRGPFRMLTPHPIEPEHWYCVAGTGEDPFLWKTQRGWHMLYHGMCPSGFLESHYATAPFNSTFSSFQGVADDASSSRSRSSGSGSDAWEWIVSPRQTYPYEFKYSDRTSRFFSRVERPQLVFDGTTGEPVTLLNGVCDGSTIGDLDECLFKQDGMTWTGSRTLVVSASL